MFRSWRSSRLSSCSIFFPSLTDELMPCCTVRTQPDSRLLPDRARLKIGLSNQPIHTAIILTHICTFKLMIQSVLYFNKPIGPDRARLWACTCHLIPIQSGPTLNWPLKSAKCLSSLSTAQLTFNQICISTSQLDLTKPKYELLHFTRLLPNRARLTLVPFK